MNAAIRNAWFAATLALVAGPALAQFIAARGPVTAVPNSVQTSSFGSGRVELNENFDPVLVEGLYNSTTHVVVDDRGLIRGSAAFDLTTLAPVTLGETIPDTAMGTLTYTGSVVNLRGNDPVPIRFEFAFHGAFTGITGAPTMALIAVLQVTTVDGLFSPRIATYSSSLAFTSANGGPLGAVPRATVSVNNGLPDPFAGAQPSVASATFENLSGMARVGIDLRPGTRAIVSATLSGSTLAALDATGTQRLPSAGKVDFENTGVLRIVVPQGVTLDDPTGQIGAVVTTVPEPAPWALALAGAALLAARRRRAADL